MGRNGKESLCVRRMARPPNSAGGAMEPFRVRQGGCGRFPRVALRLPWAMFWNPLGIRSIGHSSFHMRPLSFIIYHSPFIIRYSSLGIHHSAFIIRHSSFGIRHSSFAIHHSPFILHPSAFILLRPAGGRAT